MKRVLLIFFVILAASVMISPVANASGISVDAGLTPAEDRWIVRTMVHYMERDDDPTLMSRKSEMYNFNTVLAYGLRRDLTLILKQPALRKKMSMAGNISRDTGFSDSSFIIKYGIHRRNTAEYTFGASATLGFEFPTGSDGFSSETWDVRPGIYLSYRRGLWASDFNMAYKWNGFADDGINGMNPGDELSLDLALGYQLSIGGSADVSLTPVMEMSYKDISPDQLNNHDVSNTGESVFFLSPGIKLTKDSLILEALAQFPVWQDQEGLQTERDIGIIIGMRFMF